MPAPYKGQYDAITEQVRAFENLAPSATARASTVIGAELLSANGNIGARLLTPQAMTGVVAELDALQALGVQGVTVAVSYPLLLQSTPDNQGYLSFYKAVAAEVRKRGLVLAIEANPVFAGSEVTPLTPSFAALTLDSYVSGQRQQAQTIIDELKPDYLSLMTEPETFSYYLHLNLNSAAALVSLLRAELDGLRRGNTRVGAGTGSWSDPAWALALLDQTSIDYLDIHVYPLSSQNVSNLETLVQAAAKAGRTLNMSETWLYKDYLNGNFDLQGRIRANPGGAASEQKVVSYDFWQPLDTRFVAAMVRYVRDRGFAYVSFFDITRAGYAYLKWTPDLETASYQAFTQQYNQLVASSFRHRTPTSTGLALRDAIAR